jgi:hypothetical protein
MIPIRHSTRVDWGKRGIDVNGGGVAVYGDVNGKVPVFSTTVTTVTTVNGYPESEAIGARPSRTRGTDHAPIAEQPYPRAADRGILVVTGGT